MLLSLYLNTRLVNSYDDDLSGWFILMTANWTVTVNGIYIIVNDSKNLIPKRKLVLLCVVDSLKKYGKYFRF